MGFIPTVTDDICATPPWGSTWQRAQCMPLPFDDQFVGALSGAVANRPTCCLESRVVLA